MIIEELFIKHGFIQRISKDSVTAPVDTLNLMDDIRKAIKAELKRLQKENTILKKQISTRERIVGILQKFSQDIDYRGQGKINVILRGDFNNIASEILGEEREDDINRRTNKT